jgi:hypothetical protein
MPPEYTPGWTVLAPTIGPEAGTDGERLQADQEPHRTVEPGVRWSTHPAAIRPVGREQPERMAAVARLTVEGWLVSAVIQRQVRRSLHDPDQQRPGNTGPTATPTAAVVFARFPPVMRVQGAVDHPPHF